MTDQSQSLTTSPVNRRHFIASLAMLASASLPALGESYGESTRNAPRPDIAELCRRTEVYLKQAREQSISYFLESRSPGGLIYDRVSNQKDDRPKSGKEAPGAASIAATGFGLAALVLACEDGMLTKSSGARLAAGTLDFAEKITGPGQRGWIYHFVDGASGLPAMNSEVSTIDTVLFHLGAIAAAEYFGGDVKVRSDRMLQALDFKCVLTRDGRNPGSLTFSHGFHMEDGQRKFLKASWEQFSEGILLPLMSLGSPGGHIDPAVWDRGWDRTKSWLEAERETFQPLPLFTYYYPLGFLNLRDKQDRSGDNFWQEGIDAVYMQERWCGENGYPAGLFGVSACDGPGGYAAYYPGHELPGKVIAPPSVLASYALAPELTALAWERLDALRLLDGRYGPQAAFDAASGWTPKDTLGIDVGSMLLMLDSFQTGTIHKLIAESGWMSRAFERAGFQAVAPDRLASGEIVNRESAAGTGFIYQNHSATP